MDSVPPAGGGGGLGAGGGPGPGYPESTDSSPRSRGGDSWDEPFPSSAAAAAAGGGGRLRLMCSFGGRIVPRPTDKSLCYLGGETRIVAVDRNASLADVHARLSRSLLSGQPFTLKYQLPNEDLDSLISVSTDEDLDNLVDEYDRVAAASSAGGSTSRTSRIRLFLFPAKPESSSSLGSLLDDTSKSETWFVDALNSAISGSFDGIPRGISTDSASVNCLLGLEDDSSQHSRSGVPSSGPSPADHQLANQQKHAAAAAAAAGRHQHDVQSVPDSPMLDKNSSFGSTSSAPSLSNLPPIRVRQQEVTQPDSRVAPPTLSVEDHFAQMGISSDQPPHMVGYLQQPLQQAPIPAMGMPVATMPPPEVPSRVFSDDERSDHGGGVRMTQPPKQEVPPTADPRTMYYNDMSPRNETDAASYRAPAPASDAAAAAQPPPGYVYAQMQAQQQLHQQPQQQLHQQPQQQLQQQPPQQLQQQPPQQQIQLQPQQQLQQQAQQQLQQQPPQQQLQQQAQQQLQQQPPPQQQHQPGPQQIVMAGNQHFIHNPATGTFIPIQSYYHQPVPQAAPQQQQASAFDPNTGMYYIPMRPNAPQQYSMPPGAGAPMPAPTLVESAPKPTVPIPQQYMKPELQQQQPGLYRTAAPAAPLPGSNAAPGYAGMGYHHVIQPHHHPAQQPAATMAGNYGYEYPADPRAQQVFYSQAGAPPASLAPQYQPAMGSPDASQADLNQNRGS